MATTTLRQLNGFDEAPASLADATLIMVDFQRTYTRGVLELSGWRAALDAAAALLARAREAGTPVVHVAHDGGPGTPYDIRAEIGSLHPAVAPADGEPVVVKRAPNAFHDTDLQQKVEATGRKNVIIAGFMTHMCVTFTAEGAFLRGYAPTVVADACATRPLTGAGTDLSAEQVHHSALATIGDLYGVVVAKGADLA
ncbi:cysteine hydrolase family protein [Streptomyces sp. NPDC042319]|uniref:cysteine hydrolase family protein n=1 Tax=Streptomyces sp. NPDC042319 TaxID=3154332 RepID=UPI0033D3150A